MNRLTLAAVLLASMALATSASAVPLTLTGPIQGNTVGPQSTSNPCIIAGTQCQQPASMGFNNFVQGGVHDLNAFSTTPTATLADGVQGTPYTVAQLTGAVGTMFDIAIDVNTTGAAGETLNLFEVIINGVVAYNYVGPTNIAATIANQGNGFADWTLGTVSLAGLPAASTVLFHAVWSNATDGAESFFLVPVPGPLAGAGVPGLIAACGGLFGFNFMRRRRNGGNLKVS